MTETNVDVFNDTELTSIEAKSYTITLEKTVFIKLLTEAYRQVLINHYKSIMEESFIEGLNLDLMDEFITEAAQIMQASNNEILKMFFEDARNKYAGMEDEDYFNQLFEVGTQFP